MIYLWFQFKVKPELHYGEEDCPVSVADGFPKDDELHFEIELIEFSKVKVRFPISRRCHFEYYPFMFSCIS